MTPNRMFNPAQCRAARGLLNWSLDYLATVADIELETLEAFEKGALDLNTDDQRKLRNEFEVHGVKALAENMAGVGVRFRQPGASL